MCRIAGLLQYGNTALEVDVLRMREAMRRGGPDDAGIFLYDKYPLAFGHRRLSIIDTSTGGHQPMSDHHNQLVICYNGEVYNFPALRSELTKAGHHFQTQTDTEVILKAYAEWGAGSFQKLNGMYAFALLDQKKDVLYLVRDPQGIKPLYYHTSGDNLTFASEIRAFRALRPDWPENPDWRIFFLTFGHLPEPVTTLREVSMLPAGHYLQLDLRTRQTGLVLFKKTWSGADPIIGEEQAIAAVRRTLTESVSRQLVSDVPIGLFLSGGTDSSVLTLIAAGLLPERLHTTAITFGEPGFSEAYYQNLVVEKTGSKHDAHLLTRTEFDDSLDDIMAAMDQPSVDGVNTYFVCRYARSGGLTVALSGIGADELFGGYPSFQFSKYMPLLRFIPPAFLSWAGRYSPGKWQKLAALALPGLTGEYLFYRGLFNPADTARIAGRSEAEVKSALVRFAEKAPPYTGLPGNRASYLEQNFYMRNQLLKDTDYMSMWHSLEVRVPFLDMEFIHLMDRVAPGIKYGKKPAKRLLIKSFEQTLPRPVWDRPKRGFTFPFSEWFKTAERFNTGDNTLQYYRRRFLSGELNWSKLWAAYLAQA